MAQQGRGLYDVRAVRAFIAAERDTMRLRLGGKKVLRHVANWSLPKKTVSAIVTAVCSALAVATLVPGTPATVINYPELHLPPPYTPSEASTEKVRPAAFVGPRSDRETDLCLFAEVASFDYSTGRYSRFADKVSVSGGQAIGYSVTTMNMETPPNGGLLTNVSLTITVPKGRRRVMSIGVAANADNIDASSTYAHSDTVVLKSDEPFSIESVRAFQVAEDEAVKDKNRFTRSRYQFLPQRTIDVEETETETRYTVRPLLDGSLGPSHHEDFELLLNADVT